MSTDDTARRASGREPTTAVWREQALVEISAHRFTADRMQRVDPEALAKVHKSLENAYDAAVGKGLNRRQRLASSWRGASVERTWGQINAAEEAMLRIGPDEYVRGQLPRVLRRVRRSLPDSDARRVAVEEIVRQQPNSPDAGSERGVLLTMLSKRLADGTVKAPDAATILGTLGRCQTPDTLARTDRDAINTAFHAANCEARKKQTRVRSFRNVLLGAAAVLSIARTGTRDHRFQSIRRLLPVCSRRAAKSCARPTDDGDARVTPPRPVSRRQSEHGAAQQAHRGRHRARLANGPDILLIEVVGLIAAAVAAAAALRDLKGTSNPVRRARSRWRCSSCPPARSRPCSACC